MTSATVWRYTIRKKNNFTYNAVCDICHLEYNGVYIVVDNFDGQKELRVCADCLEYQEDRDMNLRKVADVL